jgi:hypothetical protein
VPYSFKLFLQEMQTLNVQMRIITADTIDATCDMRYSTNINRLLGASNAELTELLPIYVEKTQENIINAAKAGGDDVETINMLNSVRNTQIKNQSQNQIQNQVTRNTQLNRLGVENKSGLDQVRPIQFPNDIKNIDENRATFNELPPNVETVSFNTPHMANQMANQMANMQRPINTVNPHIPNAQQPNIVTINSVKDPVIPQQLHQQIDNTSNASRNKIMEFVPIIIRGIIAANKLEPKLITNSNQLIPGSRIIMHDQYFNFNNACVILRPFWTDDFNVSEEAMRLTKIHTSTNKPTIGILIPIDPAKITTQKSLTLYKQNLLIISDLIDAIKSGTRPLGPVQFAHILDPEPVRIEPIQNINVPSNMLPTM